MQPRNRSCCRSALIAINAVLSSLLILGLIISLFRLNATVGASGGGAVALGYIFNVAQLNLYIVGCVAAKAMHRCMLIGYFVGAIIRLALVALAVIVVAKQLSAIDPEGTYTAILIVVAIVVDFAPSVACIALSGVLAFKGFLPTPAAPQVSESLLAAVTVTAARQDPDVPQYWDLYPEKRC